MSVVPYRPQPSTARPSWLEVMDRGLELAEVIANTEFVPRGLRGNQPAILAAILYGHEVGLEPMQSLAKISVIDGKPTLAAEAQRALILAAGHELWIEESTVTRATVAGRRLGSKTTSRVTWTLDDAKRARIAGKQNWQAYPRQMLLARATAELARVIFADVIGGFAATEELADVIDIAPEPEPEEQPARTTTRRRRRAPQAAGGKEPELPPEPEPEPQAEPEPVSEPKPEAAPEPEPADEPAAEAAAPDPPNRAQLGRMFALFTERGFDNREDRLAFSEKVVGHQISSSTELSALEASRIIEALEAEPTFERSAAEHEQALVDAFQQELDAREVE